MTQLRLLLLCAALVTEVLLAGAPSLFAQNDRAFRSIGPLVNQAIERGDLPGAVVCLADAERIRFLQTFGNRRIEPEIEPMTDDTVFDLASITKPVATATSIHSLVQAGRLQVTDPVSKYLPEFTGHQKQSITVAQCLLHTSGLTPDNALADYNQGPAEAWRRICALQLRSDPGVKFAYSDVGFIVLGKLVERLSGKTLDQYASEQIFQPLGMNETSFNPPESLRGRIAPTEKQGNRWLCGSVHDPRAARLGGVAGHAGLFSSVGDLIAFGRQLILASKGKSKVFEQAAFESMTQAHPIPRGSRTLGWDHKSPYSRNRGKALSDVAFGHGGFTGTVFWIDPQKELIFVFLSSRLHPDGKGSVNTLAGQIATIAGENW